MTPVRLVIVGHVDHGKSTLIGRLLADTNSLPTGKLAEVQAACDARGSALEYAYLLDAFQAERDQAITIDSTQVQFRSAARAYTLIDAPGHKEFLKNMMTGATQADAAIVVVDVTEGMRAQTRRHITLLSLLGIERVIVVLNKMDKVQYDQALFEQAAAQVQQYLTSLPMMAVAIVPVAAQQGAMLASRGMQMNWYKGPTVLGALDALTLADDLREAPLRIAVQDVYRQAEERIVVGKILSGQLKTGDPILFSPENVTARVASLAYWPPTNTQEAQAGEAIAFTLDDAIFVERGSIASHVQDAPMMSTSFKMRLFWVSPDSLSIGDACRVRYGTADKAVQVQAIEDVIDAQDLSREKWVDSVPQYHSAWVTFVAREKLPFERGNSVSPLGRAVIYHHHILAGCGLINVNGYDDQRSASPKKSAHVTPVRHTITAALRAARNGHAGGIFWFTGLSGAGKSTLAMAVEQALFAQEKQVCVLDGDNLRHGLNGDLGFSAVDRAENSRRAGEVAALQARSGLIVLAALISPYQADRDRARATHPHAFHEIYIRSSLALCEARDPKGLYKKARAGLIAEFTGVDSPYEEPRQPDLVVDTAAQDVDSCVAQIVAYIVAHTSSPQKERSLVSSL